MTPDRTWESDAGAERDPATVQAFLSLMEAAASASAGPEGGAVEALLGAQDFARLLGFPGLVELLRGLRRAQLMGVSPPAAEEAWSELRGALRAGDQAGTLLSLRELEAAWSEQAARLDAALAAEFPPTGESTPMMEVLAGFPVRWGRTHGAPAASLELSPECAGCLRAALEWLGAAGDLALPLDVEVDDTVVEVTLPRVEWHGLEAAGETLSRCGGSLAPAAPGASRWRARVPWRSPSSSYLLVELGGLPLALPWAAVLRVSMLDPLAQQSLAQRTEWPVLSPLGAKEREAAGASPVILLARGLRRALWPVDRLVWRMPAVPDPSLVPPLPWLGGAVRTSDGESFWEVDVEKLFAMAEASGPSWWKKLAAPPRGPKDTPLVGPAPPESAKADRPREGGSDAAAPQEPGRVLRAARALVAEDSFTASRFLMRMLQTAGLDCRTVDRFAALREALERESWDLVCVDVELPDARGHEALSFALAHGAPTVALVRDAQDEDLARRAGITRTLRKPFDQEEVLRLLAAAFPPGRFSR